MQDFMPAFAVIRVYRDQLREPATDEELELLCNGTIAVVRIYWKRETAQAEAERLNSLNAEKGAFYCCQHTRVQKL